MVTKDQFQDNHDMVIYLRVRRCLDQVMRSLSRIISECLNLTNLYVHEATGSLT